MNITLTLEQVNTILHALENVQAMFQGEPGHVTPTGRRQSVADAASEVQRAVMTQALEGGRGLTARGGSWGRQSVRLTGNP